MTPPPNRARTAPRLLTVRATADRLQVAEKTVRRLIAAGALPTHRIGGCVRVSEDDLLVFLAGPGSEGQHVQSCPCKSTAFSALVQSRPK